MNEPSPDSDHETSSDVMNSSQSSLSETSSTASRLSFESSEIPAKSLFRSPSKPHKRLDLSYEAIRTLAFRQGGLNFKDFRLIRRLGSGDISNVYLCQLRTLDFEALNFSCVVMEFCSGGDLHGLRHKQEGNRFSLSSARFYAAEVLLALEYLHMLGIIYRDLKPENVLVRSDGHIMLSDFDLSLKCKSDLSVESTENLTENDPPSLPATVSCIPRCFFRSQKVSSGVINRQFIAEPTGARSCSFVGTHEYVSPEVATGKSHGSTVDWWAFGVFLYELMYGRTPFCGVSHEATLENILKKPLAFPPGISDSPAENSARKLISGLLVKDPARRLGSKRGAADVKTHSFFKGLNFALIRSYTPPHIPSFRRGCYERKPVEFGFF